MIMWTAEEVGIIGAQHYIKSHKPEEKNLQFVMESDMGTFMPLGLEFTGTEQVKCVLERIMKLVYEIILEETVVRCNLQLFFLYFVYRLLSPMGQMKLRSPSAGPDISLWVDAGVPGASLWTQNEKYFYYHHSNADTMLVEDPGALDRGTALFAAVSYVLADLSIDLPRHGNSAITV